MDKFAGLGLKNIFLIWIIFIIFTLFAKVIFTKYHIDGISQLIQAV